MSDFLPDWVPTITRSTEIHSSPSPTSSNHLQTHAHSHSQPHHLHHTDHSAHSQHYQHSQRPLAPVREESIINRSSVAGQEDDPELQRRSAIISQQEPRWKGPYQDLTIFLPEGSRIIPFTLILLVLSVTIAGDVGIVWAIQQQWRRSNPNYKLWIFAFAIWAALVTWQLLSLVWHTLLWARFWAERRPLVARSYLRSDLHLWTSLFGTREQRAALRYFRRNKSHKIAEFAHWWMQGWTFSITQVFRSCLAVALLLLPRNTVPRGAKVVLLYFSIGLSVLILWISFFMITYYSLTGNNEQMRQSVFDRIRTAWDVADRPIISSSGEGRGHAAIARMTKRAFIKEKVSKLSLKLVKSGKGGGNNLTEPKTLSDDGLKEEKEEQLTATSSPNTPATATSTPSPAQQSYMSIPKPDSPFAFSAGSISSLGTEISARGMRSIFYRPPGSPGPNTLQLSHTPSPSHPSNQESSGTSGTMTSVGELLPQSLRLFQTTAAESLASSSPKPIFPVSPLPTSAALSSEILTTPHNDKAPVSPLSRTSMIPTEAQTSQNSFKHQVRSSSNLSKSSIIFEQPSSIHSAPTPKSQSFSSVKSNEPKVERKRRHTGPQSGKSIRNGRMRSGSESHAISDLSSVAKDIWTSSTKSLRSAMSSHDYLEVSANSIIPSPSSNTRP